MRETPAPERGARGGGLATAGLGLCVILAVNLWPEASPQLSFAGAAAEPLEWAWLKSQPPLWDEVEVAPAPEADDPERGAALFAQHCASCHGAEGAGDGALAAWTAMPPRDFTREFMRLRSVDGQGHALPEDVYRTISAGISPAGMPGFGHLPSAERWALVRHVTRLSATFQNFEAPGAAVREVTQAGDASRGRALYERLECAKCHGAELRGDGPSAATLKDDRERPIRVPDLTRGRARTKLGGQPESITRILQTGLLGSPMPAFTASFKLDTEAGQQELADLAAYVAGVIAKGDEARQRSWLAFFEHRHQWGPVRGEELAEQEARWPGEGRAESETAGCTSCHTGLHDIADALMKEALVAASAGRPDFECAVCHEGDASASTKAQAHAAMITNPGSLWVTSIGLGCAKCHSDQGALQSLHGEPLPEAVGGALMSVVSKQSDPSGLSGGNHAYRMQRGLMALEFGKVTHVLRSASLIDLDAFKYADFNVDDTDGPVPHSGTEAYKAFMKKAEAEGTIRRMDKGERVPSFDEAVKLLGEDKRPNAAYVDYYRKDCGRCHLWGEGKASKGEHRSAGCSACHVLTGENAWYEGEDPTIPRQVSGHIKQHKLVLAPPVEQCNHCHTRGQTTERHELHGQAGMICADCHTSIDVHGDGNLYPTIPYQMEVRCADCHGTKDAYPWELPVGYENGGTQLEGARGVYEEEGKEYLLTSRGNPRVNWRRIDGQAAMFSLDRQQVWIMPMLKDGPLRPKEAVPEGLQKFRDPQHRHIPAHTEQLECYACHSSKAPRCQTCHINYIEGDKQVDWVQSGLRFSPKRGRQTLVKTPGAIVTNDVYGTFTQWKPGEIRSRRKIANFVRGCQVTFTFYGADGKLIEDLEIPTNPLGSRYPTGLGPVMAHEWERGMTSCATCHPNPETGELPEGIVPKRPQIGPAEEPGKRDE